MRLEHIVRSGNTPLVSVELPDVPSGIEVLAKLESEEPTRSVKDRAAQRIIEELLIGENYVIDYKEGEPIDRKLEYEERLTILDSSSGNYGVSLAYFGKLYGLRVQLVVPGNILKRLLQKIREYGVEPIVTDALEGYHGALNKARELAQQPEYLYINQYDNLGNLNAHHDGTGKEIWEQTKGQVTHFVAGVGTGGTIIGVAIYLKRNEPFVEVYSIHPENDFPGIQGLQPLVNSWINQPFIDGKVMSNIFRKYEKLIANKIGITTEEAVEWWEWLRKQGHDVGMSSGANIAGIIKLIKYGHIQNGVVVTLFPDHIDRYKDVLVKI